MKLVGRIGIVVVFLLAAGCFGSRAEVGPPDARAADPEATSAGSGAYTLRVLVTNEPGGPVVEGANVVARHDRGSVAALTGPDGRAELKLPAGQAMSLTAWKQDFTLERSTAERTGPAGAVDEIVVPLFREDVTVEIVGKLAPAGASTRAADGNDVKWEPQKLYWSASPQVTKAYNARLVETNATLTWTNGPTGGGDLLIAGGRSAQRADAVQDSGSQASLGEQVERATVTLGAIDGAGWRMAELLYVGAGTGKAWAAPLGLEYKLVITGHFDGDLKLRAAPSGGLLAALIGLGAGALLLPRRRA